MSTYFLATPLGNRKNKSTPTCLGKKAMLLLLLLLVAMIGIPKPSEIGDVNIKRPNVQQLPVEHQKILDDIQKKIREEKEKEI